MTEPTTADWDRLRALCQRADIRPERVDPVEKIWGVAHGCGPVIFVAGAAKTLALFLSRWIGVPAADALSGANGAPLVIGPKPETVQPPLGRWPCLTRRELGARHIVAIPSTGGLNAAIRSALAGLGTADQVLIVSRVSQPMATDERQLAASFAPLAATARVVFMALPGEEGTQTERAELGAYGVNLLEANGFRGRCTGAGVWLTEGARPADTIQKLEDWLSSERPEDIAAGRSEAGRAALATMLSDIEKATDRLPDTALKLDEADELGSKFAHHVAEMGKRLHDLADAGEFLDSTACRKFMVDTLCSWNNKASLEGMLLDYVNTIRPGIKAELPDQATAAADLLRYEASIKSSSTPISTGSSLRKLGIAALAAVITYIAVNLGCSPFLQPWFTTVLSNMGATAAALAAFSIAGRFMPVPITVKAANASKVSVIPGWSSAELHLTNWFNGRIRSQTPTLRQECAAIRAQFNLKG